MNAEVILDIVLGTLLVSAHLGCAIVALIWRRTRFCKTAHTIHCTQIGCFPFGWSVLYGIIFPIAGFTVLDGGQSGTKVLISAIVFCPMALAWSTYLLCFCIFLDGKTVVKRVLWSETRIKLDEPGAYILAGMSFGSDDVTIVSDDGTKIIDFGERHVQGNVKDFLKIRKQICEENKNFILNSKN